MQNATRIFAENSSGSQSPILLDDNTGHLITIPAMEHWALQGVLYNVSKTFQSVADSGSIGIAITTSASNQVRVSFESGGGGDALKRLFESASYSGGSQLTAYSHDRSNGSTTTASFWASPTVESTCTMLLDEMIIGGEGPKAGGGGESTRPWILDTSGCYLLQVTNISGGAQNFSITAHFTELGQ